MQRLNVIGIISFLLISLFALGIGEAMAKNGGKGYTELRIPLSVGEGSDPGYSIPKGSTVYHIDDGITEVYGPDKKLIISAKKSDAETISYSKGDLPVTQVFNVPNGSLVHNEGKVTTIFKDASKKECLVTIVDQRSKLDKVANDDYRIETRTNGTYTGWVEWAGDRQISRLEYARAYWNVPSSPPDHQDPQNQSQAFLFNSVEESASPFNEIIQPVLEYNQQINYNYTHRWTGRAMAVDRNDAITALGPTVECSTGDRIVGVIYRWYGPYWCVNFFNSSTGEQSYIFTNQVPFENVWASCALEVRDADDGNSDLPGTTLFENLLFRETFYYGPTIPMQWQACSTPGALQAFTGLKVTWGSNWVKLWTPN